MLTLDLFGYDIYVITYFSRIRRLTRIGGLVTSSFVVDVGDGLNGVTIYRLGVAKTLYGNTMRYTSLEAGALARILGTYTSYGTIVKGYTL